MHLKSFTRFGQHIKNCASTLSSNSYTVTQSTSSEGPVFLLWSHLLLACFLASPLPFSQAAVAPQASAPPVLSDPALASIRAAVHGGQLPVAEGQLRVYLDAHPTSAEALYLLASTLLRENKPKDSLEVYTRAARMTPPTASDFRSVALDYVLLNDYTDADKWIAESARHDPQQGETWYVMGRIKYTENRFAEAVASFKRALQLMPRSVKAEDNLGLSYEGLNQPDEALKAYRQAIVWANEAGHPNEQPLLNLGILLTDRNQLAEALPLLQQAEAINPGYGKTHGALGKLYARQNVLPSAQKELELAVAASPEDSGLHFQLGQVYRKQGMTERASTELTRAAALEQKDRQH